MTRMKESLRLKSRFILNILLLGILIQKVTAFKPGPTGMEIPDGMDCRDGKKPMNKAERAAFRKILEDHPNGIRLTIRSNLRTYTMMINSYYGPNCKSKRCWVDDIINTPICGIKPMRSYGRRKSCLDGSDNPLKEPRPGARGMEGAHIYYAQIRLYAEGNFNYRQWCQRPVCRFFPKESVFLCRSNWIQGNGYLMLMMATALIVRQALWIA